MYMHFTASLESVFVHVKWSVGASVLCRPVTLSWACPQVVQCATRPLTEHPPAALPASLPVIRHAFRSCRGVGLGSLRRLPLFFLHFLCPGFLSVSISFLFVWLFLFKANSPGFSSPESLCISHSFLKDIFPEHGLLRPQCFFSASSLTALGSVFVVQEYDYGFLDYRHRFLCFILSL